MLEGVLYTIHHQVFEKILHDIYLNLLEKFGERTPLSLNETVELLIKSSCNHKNWQVWCAMNKITSTLVHQHNRHN